jgi:uroporphyrinogen-III synthase
MSRLAGKRIVNTRAVHQAAALDQLLAERGAVAVAYPCIAVDAPADPAPLYDAVSALATGHFDWLVLTSANAAQAVGVVLNGARVRCRVAAVGEATAHASQTWLGVAPDLLPERYDAQTLGEALVPEAGARILLPQSEIANPMLGVLLRTIGANVTSVTAYRTVRGNGGDDLAGLLRDGHIDALTLTSASTAQFLAARLREEAGAQVLSLAQALPAVCIGAQTAKTAREHGFGHVVTARQATLTQVLDTLETLF